MSSLAYYLTFALIIVCLIYISRRNRQLEPICKVLAWVVMTLFAGLRVGLGRDYMIYINGYTDPLGSNASFFEMSWKLFNFVCRDLIGLSTHAWLMLVAGVTYALVMWGMKRWRIDWTIGLIVYILLYRGYFETFNTVRQSLAVSIGFVALSYLPERRYWTFIGLLGGAMLAHMSAIFLVLAWPITSIRWSRWLLGGGLLLTFVLSSHLLLWLVSLLSYILPQRYGFYLNVADYTTVQTTGTYQYLLLMLGGLCLYILSPKLYDTDRRLYTMAVLLIVAVYVYNVFQIFEPALRLMLYFFCTIFALLPSLLTQPPKYGVRPWGLAVLGLFVLFMLKDMTDPNESYSSYQTVLDQTMPIPTVKK